MRAADNSLSRLDNSEPTAPTTMPQTIASVRPQGRSVESRLSYIGRMTERPRYYVNDISRDVLTLDSRAIHVEDARFWAQPPSLAREGFALLPHKSAVSDFGNAEEIARIHQLETERLLLELTDADQVVFSAPIVRRFAQRSRDSGQVSTSGKLYNSGTAYFVHIDVSDSAAVALTERWRPKSLQRSVRRSAHYNCWRVVSPPPQDMPLAVCDSRSVSATDLVKADAMMDIPGKRESSYESLVVRYNPRHRWSYFSNMNRDEILVFKTHDSDPGQPNAVPHSAFSDPTCPPGVVPRTSIELRAIAFWFGD
jgi:hypothetical protein